MEESLYPPDRLMIQVPFSLNELHRPTRLSSRIPGSQAPGLRSGREGTAPPHSEVRNCLLLPRERTVLMFKNPCLECEFLLNSTGGLCKKRWITRKTREILAKFTPHIFPCPYCVPAGVPRQHADGIRMPLLSRYASIYCRFSKL